MTNLSPLVEDMSAYIIAGAVASQQQDTERETEGRSSAQGIDDGVEAERLGFRRVFLSERLDIKQADVILSAVAANTTRLEVATGVIVPTERHPWLTAAMGLTMHAVHGPRFVLGLGRSDEGWLRGTGIPTATFSYMEDYIRIIRMLWAGEEVTYDGPIGTFDRMSLSNLYDGPTPPIWFGTYGMERGARLVGEHADGTVLVPCITPDAVHAAATRIRTAAERAGRDPSSIRIAASVVTAPGMSDEETRAVAHARLVTYLTYKDAGDAMAKVNGWGREVLEAVRNHDEFQGLTKVPDLTFHRHQMMAAAAKIPDHYITDTCAIGSVDECVKSLQRYIDAGADEVVTYGSTPGQNAALIEAWRNRG